MLTLTGAVIAMCVHESPRESATDGTSVPPLLRTALADLQSKPLIWVLVYFVLLFGLLLDVAPIYAVIVIIAGEIVGLGWLTILVGRLFAGAWALPGLLSLGAHDGLRR